MYSPWIKMMKNLKVEKLLRKKKKRPGTTVAGDSTVKHLHGKAIVSKTSCDNILILVLPFSASEAVFVPKP